MRLLLKFMVSPLWPDCGGSPEIPPPDETGWHYWRAGARSSPVIRDMIQPDHDLALYVCGEAYSRMQAWVEGAFATGAVVVDRLAADQDGHA